MIWFEYHWINMGCSWSSNSRYIRIWQSFVTTNSNFWSRICHKRHLPLYLIVWRLQIMLLQTNLKLKWELIYPLCGIMLICRCHFLYFFNVAAKCSQCPASWRRLKGRLKLVVYNEMFAQMIGSLLELAQPFLAPPFCVFLHHSFLEFPLACTQSV